MKLCPVYVGLRSRPVQENRLSVTFLMIVTALGICQVEIRSYYEVFDTFILCFLSFTELLVSCILSSELRFGGLLPKKIIGNSASRLSVHDKR